MVAKSAGGTLHSVILMVNIIYYVDILYLNILFHCILMLPNLTIVMSQDLVACWYPCESESSFNFSLSFFSFCLSLPSSSSLLIGP